MSEIIGMRSSDRSVRLFSMDGKPIGKPFLTEGTVTSIAISPDDRFIAAGGGHLVYLWNIENRDIGEMLDNPITMHFDERPIWSVDFSHDGRRLLAADLEGFCCNYDVDKVLHVFRSSPKELFKETASLQPYATPKRLPASEGKSDR
jgi:WD40 repeat protein